MSKTDKDRPYNVRVRDNGYVRHDHRSGVCIVDESYETWRVRRHHYRVCRKYVRVEFTCTKAEPYRGVYRLREQACWTSVCGCPIPDSWKRELHACENRVRVGCIGHTRREYREDVPCACDDFPPTPTCYWVEADSERFSCFGGGGVPGWFIRVTWHGPERGRERTRLGAAARAYNAGDDLEDFDFENPQARNRGRYYWY